MGYARVISGGDLGRYTIELDYGASTRAAILAAMDVLLAELVVKMAAVAAQITTADETELAQQVKVAQAQEAYITESQNLPAGSPAPSSDLFRLEVQNLTKLRSTHAPLRLNERALKFDHAQAQRRRAYWAAFSPVETRDAWCVDYTEDRAAEAFVATVDVPGEPSLILLAPGARAWAVGDGILRARELMSPEQAYFNAAILPGWQKDKPTYRWGTITGLNFDADTADVSLSDARSSAQNLPVNQSATLEGVPVTYMSCNAMAFEVGDRVIVQFTGQDWRDPAVIGFVDNPKSCVRHFVAGVLLVDSTNIYGLNGGGLPIWTGEAANNAAYNLVTFRAKYTAFTLETLSASAAGTLSVKYRVNGGSWVDLIRLGIAPRYYYTDTGTEYSSNSADPIVGSLRFSYNSGTADYFPSPYPADPYVAQAGLDCRTGEGLFDIGDICEVIAIYNGKVRFSCAVQVDGSTQPNIASSGGNMSDGVFKYQPSNWPFSGPTLMATPPRLITSPPREGSTYP